MTAVKNNQATMHVDLEAIDGARAAGAMKRRKKATAASRADGARLSISATQGGMGPVISTGTFRWPGSSVTP